MIPTAQSTENLTLNVTQEIHVRAPLDVTFAALLEQLGRTMKSWKAPRCP